MIWIFLKALVVAYDGYVAANRLWSSNFLIIELRYTGLSPSFSSPWVFFSWRIWPNIRSQYFLGILNSSPSTCQAISWNRIDQFRRLATHMKNHAFEIVTVISYRICCIAMAAIHDERMSGEWWEYNVTSKVSRSMNTYPCSYQIIMTTSNKPGQATELTVPVVRNDKNCMATILSGSSRHTGPNV